MLSPPREFLVLRREAEERAVQPPNWEGGGAHRPKLLFSLGRKGLHAWPRSAPGSEGRTGRGSRAVLGAELAERGGAGRGWGGASAWTSY